MREHILALLQKHLPGNIKPGSGGNVSTKCPFHKQGQERRSSFGIDIDRGIWQCFSCHLAGDIRYLLRLLGLTRQQVDLEVSSIQQELDANRQQAEFKEQHFFVNKDPFKAKHILPESLLGVYEWCPTSLVEKGFNMDLLKDMEIGFDRNLQRITYPLRDLYGQLAGISGGATLQTQQPKYLVYQGGRTNSFGKWVKGDFGDWFDNQFQGYTCENHLMLWNYNRVYPRASQAMSDQDATVFLVEGFKACLWMIQCGYINTVAVMGSYISETQQRMLHRLGGNLVLFFDNDKAGREAAAKIGKLLWRPMYGRIKVAQYPDEDVMSSHMHEDNTQPDDYEIPGVHQMVATSLDYNSHIQKWRAQNVI
jgi:DNA primase